MDVKGIYSTSALQLKQTKPHVVTTTEQLKPNLNSFASCHSPLGAANIWKLKSEDAKHTHSSQQSTEIINKWKKGFLRLRKWWRAKHESHCVTRFQMKQSASLNISHFRGQKRINCFCSSTADPLWDLSWFMKPCSVWTSANSPSADMKSSHLPSGPVTVT